MQNRCNMKLKLHFIQTIFIWSNTIASDCQSRLCAHARIFENVLSTDFVFFLVAYAKILVSKRFKIIDLNKKIMVLTEQIFYQYFLKKKSFVIFYSRYMRDEEGDADCIGSDELSNCNRRCPIWTRYYWANPTIFIIPMSYTRCGSALVEKLTTSDTTTTTNCLQTNGHLQILRSSQ